MIPGDFHPFTIALGGEICDPNRYVGEAIECEGLIRHLLFRCTRDMSIAEDLLQNVYLLLLAIPERESLEDRFVRTLVFKAARKIAIDWMRRQQMEAHRDVLMTVGYGEGFTDESQEEILARLAIADCLMQRPNARPSEVLKRVEKTLRPPMRYRGRIELRNGLLYDITRKIELPDTKIIQCVRPKLIIAHTALADELKRFPEAVYKLTPRQFEILIAEILTDRGWDVHLTPETRDGGKDILAYTNSPDIGKVLCLVEVKRYQPHHKVGLGIVRQLHGAYTSHGATKGMLVTTSTFTAPARALERKHETQLTLREYDDVAKWIREYGERRN